MRLYFLCLILVISFCSSAQTFFEFAQQTMFSPEYLLGFKKLSIDGDLSDTLKIMLNEGVTYLQKGSYKESINSLGNVLKKNDKVLAAYYYRGIAYRFQGEINLSKKDFESLTMLSKNNYEGFIELAKTTMFAGDFAESEEYYQACIKINASRPEAYMFLGDMGYRKDDLETAEKNYRKSVEVDSTFSVSRVRLAIVAAAKSKNSIAALPELNHILRHDSTSKEALFFRALVTRQMTPQSALTDINHLIKVAPFNASLKFVKGMVLVEAKDFEGAFSSFKAALRLYPLNNEQFSQRLDMQNVCNYALSKIYGETDENQLKIKEGFSKLMLGRCADAIEVLQKVVGFDNSALCQYMAAVANEHIKNDEQAFTGYSNSLRIDSTIVDPHIKIGIYYLRSGQLLKSEKELTKALRLNPSLKSIQKIRGIIRWRQQNYKAAIQDLSKIIAIDSVDREALILRMKAYLLDGDTLHALVDHEVIRKLRNHEYNRIVRIVNKIVANKDTIEALRFLDQYSSMQKSIEASVVRIELLQRQRKLEEASKVASHVIDVFIRMKLTYCLESDEAFMWIALARFQASVKNDEVAQYYFSKAIELDKNYALGYLERGKFYLTRNKKGIGKRDLKKAAELGQDEAKQFLYRLK